MRQNVHREHQVKSVFAKWKAYDVALHQPLDAHAARITEAVPTEVHRRHRKCMFGLQQAREVTRATAGFERMPDLSSAQMRLQHAEEYLAHAAKPPEILLAFRDVGEFRRIHHTAIGCPSSAHEGLPSCR